MSQLADDNVTRSVMASLGAEWRPAENLSGYTSLGVGGPANIILVRDEERLPELLRFLDEHGVAWRVLGGGTNLLVADEGVSDVVLHLARRPVEVQFAGNRVEVPAMATLGTTVMECAKRNLGGLEGLIGVPGTVGGALRMNAGAYGTQIGDVVRAITVFRARSGRVETVLSDEARFDYRHTSFASDEILLAVSLELPQRPYAEILERVRACNIKRRASQPVNEKSAGCIFKNPAGCSTGKLIDELGLKGMRIGGAMISDLHANFIVNRFQAKAADIFKLMDIIRERVLSAYGVELHEEVIIWAP